MTKSDCIEIETEDNLVDRIRLGLADGLLDDLQKELLALDPAALCHAFFRIPEDQQDRFLKHSSSEISERLLEHLPDAERVILLDRLDANDAVQVMSGLSARDQAHIVGEIGGPDGETFFQLMPDQQEEDVRAVSAYPKGTAGRLMEPTPFFLSDHLTIGAAVQLIASSDALAEELDGEQPIIASEHGQYLGLLPLKALLIGNRRTALYDVAEVLEPILDTADLNDVCDWFDRTEETRAPIVSGDGKLVGILHYDVVADLLAERRETDALKVSGVIGDELRSMPTLFRARRRLSWLSANIILNIIAASVISAYEETLSAVIALAVFLPMVSDMSGCSGNQAVAVSMREISLGLARPSDALRIWWKEVSVGLINGLVLGIIIGLVAWVWKGIPMLGAVIGSALAINTLIAVSIGGVVPLLLKRSGVDPAVASGPLLTTITDMAGFFLVLGFATLSLPYLV